MPDTGLKEDLACLFREDPHQAELDLRDAVAGLTTGGMTPAAAGLSAAIMASLPARDGADLWQRICGAGPATRSLIRLTAEVGPEFEDQADDRLEEVRGDESRHDDAVALRVSRDGTMLRMPAEERDGQVYEQGWREAACGVVAQQGSEGTMLTQGLLPGFPNPARPV